MIQESYSGLFLSIFIKFLYIVWYRDPTSFFYIFIKLFQHHILSRLFFSHLIVLVILLKSNWPYLDVLYLAFQLYSFDLYICLYASTMLSLKIQNKNYYICLPLPTMTSSPPLLPASGPHSPIVCGLGHAYMHTSSFLRDSALCSTVPLCLDYCCFVVHFEIKNCKSNFVLFFSKIILAILGFLEFP